jgi:hypothetical protein
MSNDSIHIKVKSEAKNSGGLYVYFTFIRNSRHHFETILLDEVPEDLEKLVYLKICQWFNIPPKAKISFSFDEI